jgi:hypothetical protein
MSAEIRSLKAVPNPRLANPTAPEAKLVAARPWLASFAREPFFQFIVLGLGHVGWDRVLERTL